MLSPAQPTIATPPASRQTRSEATPYRLTTRWLPPQGPTLPARLLLQIQQSNQPLPVDAFQVFHEKPAHLFLISQDLSDFHHLHPDVTGPGALMTPAPALAAKPYWVFCQVQPAGEPEPLLLQETLQPTGSPLLPAQPLLPDAEQPKRSGPFEFRLRPGKPCHEGMTTLQVEVTENGQPVPRIKPFLGAGAHAVLLSQDGRDFLHVHPMAEADPQGLYHSPITLHTKIPHPGLYKLWVQTQIDDRLYTIPWTLPFGSGP
jgi:hypothetical protein